MLIIINRKIFPNKYFFLTALKIAVYVVWMLLYRQALLRHDSSYDNSRSLPNYFWSLHGAQRILNWVVNLLLLYLFRKLSNRCQFLNFFRRFFNRLSILVLFHCCPNERFHKPLVILYFPLKILIQTCTKLSYAPFSSRVTKLGEIISTTLKT